MPSGPNSNRRVIIAFLCLFVVLIALSVGAYFAGDLGKLQERISVRESQAVLQGITEPGQIDEALKLHPSNKFVQMMAMATKAANETNAATEKLSSEIEPPAIAKADDLGSARRNELEALRGDLSTAEANAAAFLPRYLAVTPAAILEVAAATFREDNRLVLTYLPETPPADAAALDPDAVAETDDTEAEVAA